MNIIKIKYYLFFLIVFQFVIEGTSQTGNLTIDYSSGYYNDEVYYCKLYKKDSLIDSTYLNYDFTFTNLAEGTYNIAIYADNELIEKRYGLPVVKDSVTNYSLSFYESRKTLINDTVISELTKGSLDLLTNLNHPNFSPLIDRMFYVGFLSGGGLLLAKHIEIGGFGGSSFSYTNFNRDTSYTSLTNIKNERYFSWNFDIATSIRFSSNDRRDYNTGGLFLEFGTIYHFPLLFRHTYNENQKKVSTSQIHQFKNLSAHVKLGYENIALMVSYRLFDYVNGDYPELPKLKVGLSFIFSE